MSKLSRLRSLQAKAPRAQILVVEDDEVLRPHFAGALRGRGYQVQTAGDIAAALALLREQSFDLVMTDLSLPDGLGLEVVRATAQLIPPPPTLIVSSNGEEAEIEAGIAAGARDYLLKPFPTALLTTKIERFLEGSQGPLDQLLPGGTQRAFGRFRIVGPLGAGGNGSVHLAEDRERNELVALKIHRRSETETDSQRFLREAYTLALTEHPALVKILGHGSVGAVDYLVMDYVEGPTLAKAVLADGPLPPKSVWALLKRLGEGLSVLHAAQLVHRDIKPSNIILRGGDPSQPVLADFGLAKLTFDRALTGAGKVSGTPRYMSPEQFRGDPLTGQSDLFSLGLVACYAAGGLPPFPTLNGSALAAAISTRPVACPALPAELGAIVRSLVAIRRSQRPADAKALCRLLGTE